MVAWPLQQPAVDEHRLVGAVVVQHQADIEFGWCRGIDLVQKIPELDGTMTPIAPAQNVAGRDVRRSE